MYPNNPLLHQASPANATRYVRDQKVIIGVSASLMIPLILFFFWMLLMMLKNRVQLLIVLVLILLMCSADLFWILSQTVRLVQLQEEDYVTGNADDNIWEGFSLMIAFICFSLSHWIFSFKYWVCAQRLVLLLHNQNPKKRESCYTKINVAVCLANIVI